jgi:hypothetical protein
MIAGGALHSADDGAHFPTMLCAAKAEFAKLVTIKSIGSLRPYAIVFPFKRMRKGRHFPFLNRIRAALIGCGNRGLKRDVPTLSCVQRQNMSTNLLEALEKNGGSKQLIWEIEPWRNCNISIKS